MVKSAVKSACCGEAQPINADFCAFFVNLSCFRYKLRQFPHMSADELEFSKRERQAMEVLYRRGQATAQEVQEGLPDRPNYSAVRSLLGVLEDKGLVKHARLGKRYVYEPTVSPARARKGALRRLLGTFFDGSPERLVESLLDPVDGPLSAAEVARLRAMLDRSEGDPHGTQP